MNSKLTLDLGLRYEYYPLMTRADRGIEQVEGANDLASTRALTRSTCCSAAWAAIPKDLGIKVSKTLFAPRLGAVYRINDEHRLPYRDTASPTTRCRSRGRSVASIPLTLAAEFDALNPTGGRRRSTRAFRMSRPRTSHRANPAAERVPDALPRRDVSRSRIQSWNVAVERRLPYDIAVDVAYVGTAKNGGFADYRRERLGCAGRRHREPAVLQHARAQRRCPAVGADHQVALQLAAGRNQPAVHRKGSC